MSPTIANDAPVPGDSLSRLPSGHVARVRALPNDDEPYLRLRAMGLCEGRKIEVIRHGSRMIVSLSGVRIGVDRRLAEAIEVEPGP
ncbi:FeoA family protein [Wenzhouxiangella limi]|uniref:Ferrous iron transport protein A n=1 Tax=Wenzhouxiangella limi TaxID=2707351 RepID=A0A845V194_9GAMM|nr:FeoA family protein [Wenzhouxiangella limi]NDY96848.1 ferrous iron transport protein A [Wenzhouxiangella limi]